MQSSNKLIKCTCGAVVNPNWKACLVCDSPLNNYEPLKPDVESINRILKMPVSDFKKAGLLVRVRCHNLEGEEIYLASAEREAAIGKAEGLVCYTAEELVQLIKGKPNREELKAIHMVKRKLTGVLVSAKERDV